jgi:hypothetical protein
MDNLKYLLPNFEDLVDPDYDFIHDQHSPKHKNRFMQDRFAHDFFETPIFDGMLVSKASLTKSVEKLILDSGGIHKFTSDLTHLFQRNGRLWCFYLPL